MSQKVRLRKVQKKDLEVFFEHQRDPAAYRMANFPSRDREAFFTHWKKILADTSVIVRTIVVDGEPAGNIVSFVQEGQLEVGYWTGREYWNKGITSQALAKFLKLIPTRPLHAHVAKGNYASKRVLEKCGFQLDDENAEEWVLVLDEEVES